MSAEQHQDTQSAQRMNEQLLNNGDDEESSSEYTLDGWQTVPFEPAAVRVSLQRFAVLILRALGV